MAVEARRTTSQPVSAAGGDDAALSDLTVVVPARNAAGMIEACLESVTRSHPREIILVDGDSSDDTVELARRYRVRIVSDGGRGLPAARVLGAQLASTPLVALVDADIVLPAGALARLRDEFLSGGYAALQAGLHSVSGGGYWGRALADHHRTGRSRRWFGLAATVFERAALLEHGLDERFSSGEDIDLRWRLRQAGARIGVSRSTIVEHRFGDNFAFARDQWLADGHGLGRMVRAHGPRAKLLVGLPLAACLRGIVLSIARLRPQWVPYFVCFLAGNYVGLVRELASHPSPRPPGARP
jgi:glycosyltransferase involved in cell wall biosynthesis